MYKYTQGPWDISPQVGSGCIIIQKDDGGTAAHRDRGRSTNIISLDNDSALDWDGHWCNR